MFFSFAILPALAAIVSAEFVLDHRLYTFDQAEVICDRDGMKLARLNSHNIQNAAISLGSRVSSAWIGEWEGSAASYYLIFWDRPGKIDIGVDDDGDTKRAALCERASTSNSSASSGVVLADKNVSSQPHPSSSSTASSSVTPNATSVSLSRTIGPQMKMYIGTENPLAHANPNNSSQRSPSFTSVSVGSSPSNDSNNSSKSLKFRVVDLSTRGSSSQMERNADRIKLRPTNKNPCSHDASGELEKLSITSDNLHFTDRVKKTNTNTSNSSSSSNRRRKSEDDPNFCCVCLEIKINQSSAVPCMHKICQDCNHLIKKCPVCRSPITEFKTC